jgi:hypothetical protein
VGARRTDGKGCHCSWRAGHQGTESARGRCDIDLGVEREHDEWCPCGQRGVSWRPGVMNNCTADAGSPLGRPAARRGRGTTRAWWKSCGMGSGRSCPAVLRRGEVKAVLGQLDSAPRLGLHAPVPPGAGTGCAGSGLNSLDRHVRQVEGRTSECRSCQRKLWSGSPRV